MFLFGLMDFVIITDISNKNHLVMKSKIWIRVQLENKPCYVLCVNAAVVHVWFLLWMQARRQPYLHGALYLPKEDQ